MRDGAGKFISTINVDSEGGRQLAEGAVQLLLGHSNLKSTVRHLGIEVDDALEMAEQTDI
jgi:hypothetical protein